MGFQLYKRRVKERSCRVQCNDGAADILAVIFNVSVAALLAKFDVLMYRNAFNNFKISYTREELKNVVAEYNAMTEDDLWNNLQYFLQKVIPVAAEYGVNMAIHEDDCHSAADSPHLPVPDSKQGKWSHPAIYGQAGFLSGCSRVRSQYGNP